MGECASSDRGDSSHLRRCAWLFVALSWVPVSAEAEEPAAQRLVDQDVQVIEEVVVTGSRIKRLDFVSISPIATVDSEQIQLGGVTNLEDIAKDLPQLVPDFDRTSNNPGNGAAQLDLRGLGPERTLVMLNGRRAAPHDVFGAVDINNIPAALVDRVEVVTGGASAVYGSDAVTGVVNFILDTRFTGAELGMQYDFYGEGDGDVYDVSLSFGRNFHDERGHVMGFFNFQDRGSVFAGDRNFTRLPLYEDIEGTGELMESGSVATPAGIVGFPPTDLPIFGLTEVVTFTPDGLVRPFIDPVDRYNFQPPNYLQTPLNRKMVGMFGNYRVSSGVNVFAELLFARNKADQQLAPSVFFEFLSFNVNHPELTPLQQFIAANNWDLDADGIAEIFFARRLVESGNRQIDTESDSLRTVIGVEGTFGAGWDWELAYSYADTDKTTDLRNGASRVHVEQALLADPVSGECFDPSDGCVPISLFGEGSINDAGVEFIRATGISDSEQVTEHIVSFNATGDVLDLPGGPLGVAAGAEWRRLSSELNGDPNLERLGVLGFSSQSDVDGSYRVAELYGEALLPLLSGEPFSDYLGVELGARYSKYSRAGGSWTWKAGGEWSPIGSLRIRGMYQRAVRAPNINELYRVPVEFVDANLGGFADECSASRDPVGNGVADLCIAQGIDPGQIGIFEAADPFPAQIFAQGGNPELEPERADTYTVGLVIQPEPVAGLSLAVDYYRIEIDNAIGQVGEPGAVRLCFNSNDVNSAFCQRLVRGPSGNIVELTNPQFNLAVAKTRGVDMVLDLQRGLPDILSLRGNAASVSLEIVATRVIEGGRQPSPLSPFLDCAGYFGGLCTSMEESVVPEFRTNTRLTYYAGPLVLSLRWERIGELDSHINKANAILGTAFQSSLSTRSAQHYVDLSFSYEIIEHVEVWGGVSNLLKNTAPLLGWGQRQSNTAPELYDVFGRRYFMGITARM
jgi:iron complex outermembrane receptor protein